MQHRRLGRRFSRDPGHRQAMLSNMAASLIKHEQIVTTLAKAKDLKRIVDKYITLAKRGDLNSRLHQLLGPIERKCSPEEKQDIVDMLNAVAGPSAERLGPVRDGIGRLSSSLLHG